MGSHGIVSRIGVATGLIASLLLVPVLQVPADAAVQAWPGGQSARTVDVRARLGTDVSGLSYVAGSTRAADVLWAVDDRVGSIHRLSLTSGSWRPTTSGGWASGKKFTFPDGRRPDAEGLVVIGGDAWVSTERDSTGASRPSILRVPLGGTPTTLGQTQEWRLASQFPGIGANVGLEAIGHVPDSELVARGFIDQARGSRYDPAKYPQKVGGGVFFVAAEAASLKGELRGYVLNSDGTFVRVATVTNPLGLVMDLEYEPESGRLWISCDDDCNGRSATAEIRSGRFVVTSRYARPTGLENHNNEGFAITPESRCQDGVKPVFWSNDSNNGGHALRAGTLRCGQGSGAALRAATVSVRTPDGRAGAVRRLTVQVSAGGTAAQGEVIVRVARRTRTVSLAGGRATVDLGRFRTPGSRRVRVTYAGDATTAQASVRGTLRTTKALTRLAPVRKTMQVERGAPARLVARVSANGLRVTGRVRVKVGRRLVAAQVRRTSGRIVVRTPRLTRRGPVKVTVLYAGGIATTRGRAVFRVRVR